MDTIGSSPIWSIFDATKKARIARNGEIRRGDGHPVKSFFELATKVAELQFRNREHVLLFRGQGGDFRNKNGNTTLKPSLFRPLAKGNPGAELLRARFATLRKAEAELVRRYEIARFLGIERLKRNPALRWAILQHYEICPTPLLDVTHSLRIAASFASHASRKNQAFIFVLGVPNLSGAVTASAEAGLQVIRLSSVCPPTAVRPHLQEGYLLGEYPEMAGYEQKEHYFHHEIDFGRRLVAKFRLAPATFWKRDEFPRVKKHALYPSSGQDPLYRLALRVRRSIGATQDRSL